MFTTVEVVYQEEKFGLQEGGPAAEKKCVFGPNCDTLVARVTLV